jgi:hypothetical protein
MCVNRDMETAIIRHVERDISRMKALVKDVNHKHVIEKLE